MRQTALSRMYKTGYVAGDFDILDWVTLYGFTANPTNRYVTVGAPGVTYVADTGSVAFAANVDGPISMGMLSPQVIVLPAKDIVNVKAKIIWDDAAGVGEKVGWMMYIQHSSVGDTLYGTIADGFKQSDAYPEDVDYTYSLLPALDSYWEYPKTQYAIGYGTALADTIKSTEMYLLRYDTATSLKLDPTYAFRNTSEYINNEYQVLTMYIYRMAGAAAIFPPFIQDGLYDADGDGALDSDTFAGTARLLGVLLEFD